MPYIPAEWVRNEDNWPEIDYIMKYLDQDLITPEMATEQDRLIERLKAIGEDIIYEKVKSGGLSFGP